MSLLATMAMTIATGCGTTKWSDTSRTGTEQLLISQAIDRAVERIDFTILAGKKVYLNTDAIKEATDHHYLQMTLRQHVAAAGARLSSKVEECDYILDVRTGAVGTDRNDLLVGIPALSVPQLNGTSITTAQIPEIPFVKKTDQRAVVKVAIFAYDRESGHPLWASGNKVAESRAKAWWVLGAGPFNRGTIYSKTRFAGDEVSVPFMKGTKTVDPSTLPLFFDEGGEAFSVPEQPRLAPPPQPQVIDPGLPMPPPPILPPPSQHMPSPPFTGAAVSMPNPSLAGPPTAFPSY